MCQILARVCPFGMTAVDQYIRFFRSPCSCRIPIKRSFGMLLPIIQNLIKVSPALVHSIGTGKKCRITHQTVFQQAYIRIPRFLIVLVIAEVHLHGSHIETGTRFFHGYALKNSLVGLNTDNQFLTFVDMISFGMITLCFSENREYAVTGSGM